MDNKLIGYGLLFAGLAIILYAAFNVINLFTGSSEPINFFNFPGISLDTGDIIAGSIPEELRGIIANQPSQKTEIIEPALLNKPLNLFVHVVFMGFISSTGLKIAQIGAMLVRPIKVKLKSESPASSK